MARKPEPVPVSYREKMKKKMARRKSIKKAKK